MLSAMPTPSRLPSALEPLIAAQGGAFSAQQAYTCGATPDEVQDARKRGDLTPIRRGVYVATSQWRAMDAEEQYRAETYGALLVLKAPVTLSHETAGRWMDLPLLRPDPDVLHVTRPELLASRLEAGIQHHPGALPPDHVTTVRGVQVTTPARTAVDIARRSDFGAGLAAADSALRAGARHSELTEVLAFCRAWAGSRGASRAVSEADGRADNPGESLSRARLLGAGLGPTDLQVEIRDGRGLVGFADFGWLPLKVLGEFDGRGKYGADATTAAAAVWAEKIREDRLRALGYVVVRWTWADLLNPGAWLTRLRLVLADAAAGRRTA